jgi:hypothetical protein
LGIPAASATIAVVLPGAARSAARTLARVWPRGAGLRPAVSPRRAGEGVRAAGLAAAGLAARPRASGAAGPPAATWHRAHLGARERGRRALRALELADQRPQLLDSYVELLADAVHEVSHRLLSI